MAERLEDLIEKGKPYLRDYLTQKGVHITRSGSTDSFRCLHPDHPDHHPSSGFVKGTDDQVFHCFSCGCSGTVYTARHFLDGLPLYGMDFVAHNLYPLLREYGIEYEELDTSDSSLKRYRYDAIYRATYQAMVEMNDHGAFTHMDLSHAHHRGWQTEICQKIGVGTITDYDLFLQSICRKVRIPEKELQESGITPELFGPDLITFCIRDHKGVPIGFVARYIPWTKNCGRPKYTNTSNRENPFYQKEKILFGLDLARFYTGMRLDIFEGYGSLVTAQQAGYRNSCAIGGTALTEHHVELVHELGFSHLNLVMDQDDIGPKLMEKYLSKFSGYKGLKVTIMDLPLTKEELKVEGQNDPDYFIQKHGIARYREIRPTGAFEYMIRTKAGSLQPESAEAIEFCKQMTRLILNETDMIERGQMVNILAKHTGVSKDDIRDELHRLETTDVSKITNDLLRKARSIRDPNSLQDLLSQAQSQLADTGSTKKQRYAASVQESLQNLEDIFNEMEDTTPGLQGWSTGYQDIDDLTDGIPKPGSGGRLIGFCGSPQHGKALSHDTPILCIDGWKTHGSLRPGDQVFGRDGEPTQVIAIGPEVELDCEVSFSDGSSLVCHEKHEWLVHDSSAAGTTRPVEKILETEHLERVVLKKGKTSRFLVDEPRALQLEERELPLHPYALGVWLGDGTSSAPTICHSPDDKNHILKLAEVCSLVPNSSTIHRSTGVHYQFYGTALGHLLDSLGIRNNKHIPEQYKLASEQQRLELLAGLVDTDGYIYRKNGRMCFSNTNRRLVEDVAGLIRSLGSRATVAEFEPRINNCNGRTIIGRKTTYQVTFNLRQALPTALPRKHWEGLPFTNRRRGVTQIRRVRKQLGRCIQVEGGIYLAGKTLVPTHNSAILLNFAINIARNYNDVTILYWAIDDNRKTIAERLLAMISKVHIDKVRRSLQMTPNEEAKLEDSKEVLRNLIIEKKLIFKDDTFGRSRDKAENWIRMMQDQTQNQLILCVDSLHNIDSQSQLADERLRIKNNCTWLKRIVTEVPITVLATLELYKNRPREKPNLTTIVESGKAEYDFDMLAIVWHQAQGCYAPLDTVQAKWGSPGNYKPIIELDFQKNKINGRKGSVFLDYDTDTTRFVRSSTVLPQKEPTMEIVSDKGVRYSFS